MHPAMYVNHEHLISCLIRLNCLAACLRSNDAPSYIASIRMINQRQQGMHLRKTSMLCWCIFHSISSCGFQQVQARGRMSIVTSRNTPTWAASDSRTCPRRGP
jgi:hypothetical protein